MIQQRTTLTFLKSIEIDAIHPHPSLVLFVAYKPGLIGRQSDHNEKGRFVACTHGLISRQSDYNHENDNGRFVAYMPSLIDMQSGFSEEGRFVVYTPGLIDKQTDYSDNGRFVAYMPNLIVGQFGHSEKGRFVSKLVRFYRHGGVSYCVLRCELTTSVDFPYFSCCKMDPRQTHDSDSRRKQPRKRYLVQFLQQTNAAKVRLVM